MTDETTRDQEIIEVTAFGGSRPEYVAGQLRLHRTIKAELARPVPWIASLRMLGIDVGRIYGGWMMNGMNFDGMRCKFELVGGFKDAGPYGQDMGQGPIEALKAFLEGNER